MEFSVLSGVYTDSDSQIRISYPVNRMPSFERSGASDGILRPAFGIDSQVTGSGVDRGGIVWSGIHYRVMGQRLVSVSDSFVITDLGFVGGLSDEKVSLDYSFDRLAIASGNNLYYWDGSALTQVTDTDLGVCKDVIWADGYFMTTDGESIVVTELSDPTQVNPLKYGSSEADPDGIQKLLKIRREVYAVNRNTIEVFENIGGDLFPFQRISGAQVTKGAIGKNAACIFSDAVAFVGGGRNESIGVYASVNATATKISTREIDRLLSEIDVEDYDLITLESVNMSSGEMLFLRLPDRTMVYDLENSKLSGAAIWFALTSSYLGFSGYRAQNFTLVNNKWVVGDPDSYQLGTITSDHGHHWGQKVRWEMSTQIVYNENNGALIHEIELLSVTGNVELGKDPVITTSYSSDGRNWSQPRPINVGTIGNFNKRLVWFKNGVLRHWRIQKFSGDSDAHISFLRVDAKIEALRH